MIRWIPYTFVRTVIFFIAGIVCALYAPGLVPENVAVTVAILLALLYFPVVWLSSRRRRMFNPGWVGLPLVSLLGYIHLLGQTASRDPEHLLHVSEPVTYYQAMITRFPEEKERTWKLEAAVRWVHTDTWQPVKGGVLLYFSKEDFQEPFQYGDMLLIKGRPGVPEGPANPGEFDYREFLALKNIYHQHFLKKEQVLKTAHDPPYWFMDFAFRGRQWAEATLNRFIHGPREQGIASALVLGVTDGLDEQLMHAYSATGSMHILAVSGLHISVLYFILMWMLSPLQRIRGGSWTIAITALLVLWLYAFVTGLTPSVLRAVVMFSFLALSRPWGRSTNIYNTLAVSAFCLLLFDPFLVRSVGFQLSYMAVLGIVFLYPKIVLLWEPGLRLLTEIWKIAAVSIAAQVATFPLGLFYFHQFPNYFLLSNLLVVPLSFVVLVLGLVLLGASFVPAAGMVAGYCLEKTITFLNTMVFTLEGFPFSLTEDVYISASQCILLIALILMVIAMFQYRRYQYLLLSFFIAICYACLQWVHHIREVKVQRITVYKVPGHSALDLIDQGQAFFLSDTLLGGDEQKIRYHVTPNRVMAGVLKVRAEAPASREFRGGRLIIWKGRRILQIRSPDYELPHFLEADWVIIGNNALTEVARLRERVAFRKVVLDTSNTFFFATRFLEEAKLYKLDVHSVWHRGAFTLKIENQDT